MPLSLEEILSEMDKTLQSLETQGWGKELVASLRPILATNLERGRIQTFVGEEIARVNEYVQKVGEFYKQLNPLIKEIQVERTDDVWEPLFDRMHKWAYNLFIRKNFYPGPNTQGIAGECVNEAAMVVLNAHFSYDTELDSWLYVILAHACQKYIRKGMSTEKRVVDLDEQLAVEDSAVDELEYRMGTGIELPVALKKLSAPRRRCIELLYFSELPPSEVAKKMNKSIGAIYSLRFHALEDLRTIMRQMMDDQHE